MLIQIDFDDVVLCFVPLVYLSLSGGSLERWMSMNHIVYILYVCVYLYLKHNLLDGSRPHSIGSGSISNVGGTCRCFHTGSGDAAGYVYSQVFTNSESEVPAAVYGATDSAAAIDSSENTNYLYN